MSLEDFTEGYLDAMFWAECIKYGPYEGEPFEDHFGPEDLDGPARRAIEDDCRDFYSEYSHLWEHPAEASDSQAGHDFYLTRNGHGAGFWDRPDLYGEENARVLSEASRVFGTQGLDHNPGRDGEPAVVFTHG